MLDPTTPYKYDLNNLMKKNSNAEAVLKLYDEIQSKQSIELSDDMSAMFLQLICEALGKDNPDRATWSSLVSVSQPFQTHLYTCHVIS